MDVRMDGGMERRWEKLQKHRMEDGGVDAWGNGYISD